MEGHCSTGQSPQRAVVPMEEEEEEEEEEYLDEGNIGKYEVARRCRKYRHCNEKLHLFISRQILLG